jgi:hypothetical protein
MTILRIVYKNFVRNGTILASSSEHPQFPVENIQDDTLVLPWRSRYGTGTGNGLFVIGTTNHHIDFDEGGAELNAVLTAGSYNGQTLATEIKTQMDAAGGTYTVIYDESTGKFTIARTGNFTLRWNTGANKAASAAASLGFTSAADDTGAATYTSDTMVIHTGEYIDFDFGSAYRYDSLALQSHNLTASASIIVSGADDSAFTSNVVTDTLTYNANNIFAFIGTARTKRYQRWAIIDKANPSGYIQIAVAVAGKYLEPNRGFGPYTEGEIDESEGEYSPSNNYFVVQERPALISREYNFKGLTDTSIAGVRLLLAECGIRKAIWICTDTTSAATINANSIWVKLKETSLPACEQKGYWSWAMPVEQVL